MPTSRHFTTALQGPRRSAFAGLPLLTGLDLAGRQTVTPDSAVLIRPFRFLSIAILFGAMRGGFAPERVAER